MHRLIVDSSSIWSWKEYLHPPLWLLPQHLGCCLCWWPFSTLDSVGFSDLSPRVVACRMIPPSMVAPRMRTLYYRPWMSKKATTSRPIQISRFLQMWLFPPIPVFIDKSFSLTGRCLGLCSTNNPRATRSSSRPDSPCNVPAAAAHPQTPPPTAGLCTWTTTGGTTPGESWHLPTWKRVGLWVSDTQILVCVIHNLIL